MSTNNDFWNDATLKREILKHLTNETFRMTEHADEERENDCLDVLDIIHVLRYGIHDRQHSSFSNKYQRWRYAINGNTESRKKVRVIVTFPKDLMMVVTVFKF